MAEKKGRSGRLVHSLLQNPRGLLITIYIGNELVNIAISVVITSVAISLFGSAGVGIAIGISTFLLLFLGEIVPKSISLKYAQPYALFAAYPLKAFANIVQPAQKLFNTWILPIHSIEKNNSIRLLAPNDFVLKKVSQDYLGRIEEIVHEKDSSIELSFAVGSKDIENVTEREANKIAKSDPRVIEAGDKWWAINQERE